MITVFRNGVKEYINLLLDLQKLKFSSNLALNEETIFKNLPSLYSFIRLVSKETLTIEPLEARIRKILIELEQTDYNNFIMKQSNTLIIHHMIHEGMLTLNINDEEDFIKIMERYFIIKQERNDSAHALMITKGKLSTQQESSEKSYAEVLKDYMKEGIREYLNIRDLCKEFSKAKKNKSFINHTNHPSTQWSKDQKEMAEKYGKIIDFPFQSVGADWNKNKISQFAEINAKKIIEMNPAAVLCQGEYNYTYAMINYLKQNDIVVLAAASERVVDEKVQPDGTTQKMSSFKFVQFRQYQ